MEVLTPLISGLVLASASGITALAFKHPRAFAKLYPLLNVLATAAFLSLSIWAAAVHVTWTGIRPFVPAEHLAAAEPVRETLTLPYFWICVTYALLLVFFWINLKLPAFITQVSKNTSNP